MKCNIKGTFIKALEVQQILSTLEMCKKHLPKTPEYFRVRLKNKHRCKEVEFDCYSYHIKKAKTGNEILVFKTNKAKTYIEYQYKEYNSNDWFIMRMSPVYYI